MARTAALGVLAVVVIGVLPWLLRRWAPSVAAVLPVAINLALAGLFGSTLRAGSEPMIARFARAERGGVLEADLARYTRALTVVWVVFFLACALAAAWLWTRADSRAWLLFTTVGNYVAVAALFIGEYVYRRRRFAQYAHASPWVLWRHVRRVMRERAPR
jgi:uncharacterized membrane protein